MTVTHKRYPINGWVIINKSAGPTSTSVVNTVKRLMHAQKAGHAGTLDPAATGLLAVALGEATKTIPYIMDGLKTYEFAVTLGMATNTDDAEGEMIHTSDIRPANQDIQQALPKFEGHIQQIPPQFSAVKIKGDRAYKAARQGRHVNLKARPLFVESLTYTERLSKDEIKLRLRCGKGGYVRSIARDLGEKLGCFGHVKWLHRLESAPFDLSQSIALKRLETHKNPKAVILPLEAGLVHMPFIDISKQAAERLRNGMSITLDYSPVSENTALWAKWNGKAQAIGVIEAGVFKPKRVILQRPS